MTRTEIQRTGDQLEEQLALYEQIFAQSLDAIAIIDPAGQYLRQNSVHRSLVGYDDEELKGQTPAIHLGSEQFARVVEVLITEGVFRGELTSTARDGRVRRVELSAFAVRNAQGSPLCYVGIKRDLTARRESEAVAAAAQQALAENEARFREICHSLPGAVYQFQLNPDGTRSFPYVSPGSMELGGVPSVDLHTNAELAFNQIVPEDVERVELSILESAQNMTPWSCEFRIQPAEGPRRWLQGFSRPRLQPDGAIRWSGVVLDVSERKRAEAELVQAKDDAEAATRAKSQILANVSHELRTPLNAVIGMTGLLVETPPLTAEQREYAETIRTSGDALLTLIDDLLDLSKLESSKIELERVPFGLRACIESSLGLVSSRAAERGISLAYAFDGGVPEHVIGDPVRFRQIFINLLSNAVKFSHGGDVVVTVGVREASPPERIELHVQVQDPGVGIPPDRMDLLFQAFTQIDPSTTREYGGTGLGLAISKGLAERMAGRMWVESEVGRGSTFHFTVVVEPTTPEEYTPPASQRSLIGQRVLVVSANVHARRMLVQQLECWGVQVLAVATPTDPVPGIRVAIVDPELPGASSALVAEVQRCCGPGTAIVLVRSPGHGGEPPKEVSGTLMKPVRAEALLSLLRAIATRGAAEVGADPLLGQAHPARILLVEDHSINQRVALMQLERLGYGAEVAGNGQEALDALERERYDLLLMDVHMPRMDGLEATRRIRARLGVSGPRIIAMTASATAEDRGRCLKAGMDAYLSKPVRLEELRSVLEELLTREQPVDAAVLEQLRSVQPPGRPDLATELIGLFIEDTPAMIAEAQQAGIEGDLNRLQRSVHGLKGCAGNLGALPLAEACRTAEERVRAEDLEGARAGLEQVVREHEKVVEYFVSLRGGTEPS